MIKSWNRWYFNINHFRKILLIDQYLAFFLPIFFWNYSSLISSLKMSSSFLLSFLSESNLNSYWYSVCITVNGGYLSWLIASNNEICRSQHFCLGQHGYSLLVGASFFHCLSGQETHPLPCPDPQNPLKYTYTMERETEILRSFLKFQYTLTSYQLFMRSFPMLHSLNM